MLGIQAAICGVCRAKKGGLALHFGVESAVIEFAGGYFSHISSCQQLDTNCYYMVINSDAQYTDTLRAHISCLFMLDISDNWPSNFLC